MNILNINKDRVSGNKQLFKDLGLVMRIGNVEVPDQKPIAAALTYIYGIGYATAQKILIDLKIETGIRTKDLSESQATAIRRVINQHRIEGDLRREVVMNIKRLMDIGSYRGIRHRRCLPTRGQSSKQNARTCKRKKTRSATKSIMVRKHTKKKK